MTIVSLIALLLFVLILFILFEFRVRKPDQIVLADVHGKIVQRKARFYTRHFSLAVPATIHSSVL